MTEDQQPQKDDEETPSSSQEADKPKDQAKDGAQQTQEPNQEDAESVDPTSASDDKPSKSEKLTSDDDIDDFLKMDDGENGSGEVDTSAVDAALTKMAPEFQDELDQLSSDKFSGVVINKGSASEEDVDATKKAPSLIKTYIKNIPAKKKKAYLQALSVLVVGVLLSFLIFRGYLLPQFRFPYMVSLEEISTNISTYPTDADPVPLFDDFRNKSFTFALPKTTINLTISGGETGYGEFEFFLNLRDKDLLKTVQNQESQIIEIVRNALDGITWRELETPMGKERVKKLLRQKINEYLDGNMVLSVYYRSILLSR